MLGKCSHPRSPTLLAHLLPGVGHPLPPPSPVQAPGSSREQEGPGQQQGQEEEGGLRGRQDGGLQGSRTPWGQQGGGVCRDRTLGDWEKGWAKERQAGLPDAGCDPGGSLPCASFSLSVKWV